MKDEKGCKRERLVVLEGKQMEPVIWGLSHTRGGVGVIIFFGLFGGKWGYYTAQDWVQKFRGRENIEVLTCWEMEERKERKHSRHRRRTKRVMANLEDWTG